MDRKTIKLITKSVQSFGISHFKVREDGSINYISNEPQPTEEEIQAKIAELQEQEKQKQAIQKAKTEGKPYKKGQDPVSFTSEDAIGMLQVKTAFELGVTKTNIKFSNGTILPMTADGFVNFAEWFVEQRNSFFI